ncbi:MAG: DUF349 domain-containing protein [Bacteroidales bacterium]|nr:DUF349 domain-containing protein [Bacteroidales bacterium]
MEETNEMQNTPNEELQQNAPEVTLDQNTNVEPQSGTELLDEKIKDSEEPAAEQPEAAPAEPAVEEAPVNEQPFEEQPAQPEQPEHVDEEPKAETQPTEAQPKEEAEPEVDYSAMNREELVAAFNELMNEDVNKIKNRVASIRNRFNTLNHEAQQAAFEAFLADGGNKDDYQQADDAVAEAFHKVYTTYRERRQKYIEALEAQKKKNLEAKQQILEELRKLIDSDEESLKATYDSFNAIQDRWKAIGDVPRESLTDLWQNYHFLIEQFFNKVKINKELRMLDLKRNLEQKIELCEKAEELIVETSIDTAFKGLQNLRAQWKEIGPVPTEQNEEIWQRFCNAANQIDERRREYYEQRKEEFDKNLLAKQALIDKAAELTERTPESTKEWNDTTAALDELLKVWKTIGPVAREVNEEIWSKFKGMIDQHYAQKKEHFGAIRDEQNENYNKKIALCLKAEAIAKREDWKKATEELLALQAEWKEIGPTSRKVSDKVWQRFRGACDEFFAKKGEFFKDRRASESENLAKKEAIIANLKEHQFGEDREENLNIIKDFQRQWAEVGFVPASEKERLQKEFRTLINGIFEKLKISAREAEETAYRERLRNITGDARNFVNSEKQELTDRIEKLRNDLNLWENNLGFLASSKQADLLKEEFEKKMQGARQQIALLQAKLRIITETEKAEKEAKENQNNAEKEN